MALPGLLIANTDDVLDSGFVALELRWQLVAAWVVNGAFAGFSLSNFFTRLILLLVPVVLAAGWLLWNFGAGREVGAALVGMVTCPVSLAAQAHEPACPVVGEFAPCHPGAVWPWFVVAVVVLLSGSAILLAPSARSRANSVTSK